MVLCSAPSNLGTVWQLSSKGFTGWGKLQSLENQSSHFLPFYSQFQRKEYDVLSGWPSFLAFLWAPLGSGKGLT